MKYIKRAYFLFLLPFIYVFGVLLQLVYQLPVLKLAFDEIIRGEADDKSWNIFKDSD